MRITPEIHEALTRAVKQHGTNRAIAQTAGVHGTTVGHWLSGHIKMIRDDRWDRLEPVLRPYLAARAATGPHASGHPCDGKPPQLSDLCASWDQIPEGEKNLILSIVDAALKKHGSAAGTGPARKLRAG